MDHDDQDIDFDLDELMSSSNTDWTPGRNTKFVAQVIKTRAYRRGNGTEKEKYAQVIANLSVNDRDFESWRTKPPTVGSLKKHFSDLKIKFCNKIAAHTEGANLSGLDEQKSQLDKMLEAVCKELDDTAQAKVDTANYNAKRNRSMLTYEKNQMRKGSLSKKKIAAGGAGAASSSSSGASEGTADETGQQDQSPSSESVSSTSASSSNSVPSESGFEIGGNTQIGRMMEKLLSSDADEFQKIEAEKERAKIQLEVDAQKAKFEMESETLKAKHLERLQELKNEELRLKLQILQAERQQAEQQELNQLRKKFRGSEKDGDDA